jgi:hypothetical protein
MGESFDPNWPDGICSACGMRTPRHELRWISDSPFCEKCILGYYLKDWIVRSIDNPNEYVLTPVGGERLPGLVVVASCPNDGTPVYRRWVDAGIARVGDDPACPFCLGKGAETTKRMM